MDRIGFLGGGNMAEALIKGIIKSGLYRPQDIFAADILTARQDYLAKTYGVKVGMSNAQIVEEVDTVVMSVKPQNMAEVMAGIKSSIKKDTLIISIAAGKKIANITDALGDVAIVRVMPNTPALIGEGASALFANKKARQAMKKVEAIFSSVGKAFVLEDEDLMDAVTALSGSGPAYYFLLMEEMIKAGVALGLSEEISKELVLQTARGASLLAAGAKGEGAEQLRRKVTSPGGTTEAAIKVLTEGKFGQLILAAITKACERSKELSK